MLIFQSLKYQGCGNHQQQPKNAMDATTVNMEPGTTTLMQSTAVTQVGSLGPINYPSSGICSLFFLPKLPCLTPLKGFFRANTMPIKGPQPRLLHCFRNFRETKSLSSVERQARRSQDSVKNNTNLDCVFVQIALIYADP